MSDRGTARGSPLLTPRFPGLHLNFSQLHVVMWLDTGLIGFDLFHLTEIKRREKMMVKRARRLRGCSRGHVFTTKTRGLQRVALLTHAHQVFWDKHPKQAH